MSTYTYADFISRSIKLRGLSEYIYAGLWEYVLIVKVYSSNIWVNTERKAIFAVESFHKSSAQFCKAWVVV